MQQQQQKKPANCAEGKSIGSSVLHTLFFCEPKVALEYIACYF